jgi:aldehyde dehydrogenase (NAD+)
MYGPDPAASPAMACLLDDRNMARFNALVTEAQETGAAVQAGGQADIAARILTPTLLVQTTPGKKIGD